KAELKRLRNVAQKLRAALGRALVLDTDQPATTERPRSKARRTPHVAPTTRAALISQLQTLEVQIEETRSQLRSVASSCSAEHFGAAAPGTPIGTEVDRRCGQDRCLQCPVLARRSSGPPLREHE